jgi:hypothetical protein
MDIMMISKWAVSGLAEKSLTAGIPAMFECHRYPQKPASLKLVCTCDVYNNTMLYYIHIYYIIYNIKLNYIILYFIYNYIYIYISTSMGFLKRLHQRAFFKV